MIPPGVPPAIEVQAEHLEIEHGQVVATGMVTLSRAGQTIQGDRAVFSLEEQVLVVTGGSLTQDGVVLSFEEATVRVRAEEALLSGVVADGLGWHVTGAEVLVQPDGTLVLSDSAITACDPDCGNRLPWELRAATASIDPDHRLRMQKGVVRLFGLPVLPIPAWSTSLDPSEVHLEAPILGWVDGHGALRLPVRWGHPSGLSMRGTVGYWRGPTTELITRWNEDSEVVTEAFWEDGEAHGRVAAHHVWVNEDLRLGVDGQLVTDSQWLPERGRSLAERTAPWTDMRAIAGFGPARLELMAWQNEAPQVSWIPGVVLSTPTRDLGPVLGTGTARFDWVDGELRSEARGTAWTLHRGEVFEAEARVSARALAYESQAGGIDAAAWGELRLPAWRDGVLGRQEWIVGARVQAGEHWGQTTSYAWEIWEEGVQFGPVVETVAWGPGGTRAWGQLWVPWDQEAWGVQGTGRLARGPLVVGGQVQWRDGEGLMAGRVEWIGGLGGFWLDAAVLGGEELEPFTRAGGWANLAGAHNTWNLAVSGLGDAEGLGEARLGLDWQSGCDCLLIGTAVGWARDQQGPSLSVRLDLTPTQSRPTASGAPAALP